MKFHNIFLDNNIPNYGRMFYDIYVLKHACVHKVINVGINHEFLQRRFVIYFAIYHG